MQLVVSSRVESLNIAVAATKKLSITADDQIDELYVDGVLTPVQPGGWGTVRVVNIPEDTHVIAVKAEDIARVSNIMRNRGYSRLTCRVNTKRASDGEVFGFSIDRRTVEADTKTG
jgi:hypothetical protein